MSSLVRLAVTDSPDYPFIALDAPVKLDQNESPFDFPDDLKHLVVEKWLNISWNRYPELMAESVRLSLALHEQWVEAGTLITTGSNVLIALIMQMSGIGRHVITVKPNFSLYSLDAKLLGCQLTEVPLGPNFELDLNGFVHVLEKGSALGGVVYLPQPHAPTGSLMDKKALEYLLINHPNWVVVLDEAYHQFAQENLISWLNVYPNLILLRTFSKAWGLAGLRLGYALSQPSLMQQLKKLVPPFPLSCPQSITLQVALEHSDYVTKRVSLLVAERERLFQALKHHSSWTTYPSKGNFLLIRTPNAKVAHEALLGQGVLVRRQDSYFGLEGCIRVSVGTPEQNDRFLEVALRI